MDNDDTEIAAPTEAAAYSSESTDQSESPSTHQELWARMLKEHAGTRADSWRYGRMIVGQSNMEENTEIYIDMVE